MKQEDKKKSETIDNYINAQKVNSIKDSTLKTVRHKLQTANEWKDLIKWKKEDVTKYILYMQEKGLNKSYIEMNKALLKKFFRWMGKGNFVEDIKIKLPKKKLKSTDILTPDDVNKMIECSNNNMEKALIAIIYDSGGRISEILKLKVKDIQETQKGMRIDIPGTKTGEDYRPCLCVMSGQYIRNHILYPTLKPENLIFNISYPTAWRIVKDLGKNAGIDKPISPHKLRHAQTTYMVRKGYQESVIRAKMGWTDDSKMIARYQHIDGEDVINAQAEKEGNGDAPKSQQELELTKPITPAAPIKIADPSMEFSRIRNENEQLRNDYDELKSRTERLEAYLIELEYWDMPKKVKDSNLRIRAVA